MNNAEHIVKSYDSELTELDNAISRMGGITESMLARSVEALVKRDSSLASDVIHDDYQVDELENEINAHVNLNALVICRKTLPKEPLRYLAHPQLEPFIQLCVWHHWFSL